MGINTPIVIYTHTNYKDLWPAMFGRINKYIDNPAVYLLVNKESLGIPSEFKIITYTESNLYTSRLKECLIKINEEVILFIHEDMILYDKPDFELIERYSQYIKEGKADSIKLIYVKGNDTVCSFDSTLISNSFSKFSIQPTLMSPKKLLQIIDSTKDLNIWDFEVSIRKANDYMCKIGGEKKRGTFHYDSSVFPYVATAISKGIWNTNEYSSEIKDIAEEYNIDLTVRGINGKK